MLAKKKFSGGRAGRICLFSCLLVLFLFLLGCGKQPAASAETAPAVPSAVAETPAVSAAGTAAPSPSPSPSPSPTPIPTPTPIPVESCDAQKGYVSGNGINLRSGPGTEFEILDELSRGVELTITGTAEDWYRVEIGDAEGFLSAEFVGKGDVPLEYTVKKLKRHNGAVTASKVNMRSEPTTKSKIIDELEIFTHLTITGETEEWYQVEYLGQKGYISKEYLEPAVGYYSAEDLYLVAQICHQEARGTLEGQIAVANVVYNRLRSSRFPSTIEGVIFQEGQFSPAEKESTLRSVKANRNALKAVLEIFVRGKTVLPRDVLYFRAGRLGKDWASSRTYYASYGGNNFYK